MGPDQIQDETALKERMGRSAFLLLKHSHACPISAWAFEEFHRLAEDHPQLASGWLDVIGSRPMSRAVAEATGVEHASPQVLLFVDGQVVWSATHSRIRYEALKDALDLIPSTRPDSGSRAS